MAEQAGVSYADVNEIENGQVYGSIAKFRRLANCLYVPVHTIVTNDILGVPDSFFREMKPAAYLPPAKSKNAALGREGEDTALEMEKCRLEPANPMLSKLVIPCYKLHATRGYDIISYKSDGTPVFIEVKTTEKTNPGEFQLTRYELETATKMTEAGYEYWIYVFSKENGGDLRLEKCRSRVCWIKNGSSLSAINATSDPGRNLKTEFFISGGRKVFLKSKPPTLWIFQHPASAPTKTAKSSAP